MTFTETELKGVWIIDPVRHGDSRGYFCETFRQNEFEENVGKVDFVQENESFSSRGVLRGLHYQKGEYAQAKLVRVSEGRILDVVVDLRRGSATFGRHLAIELDSDSGRQLFVPRGFAHGFVVLSEQARFQYKVDNYYNHSSEACIRYDDSSLGIKWPKEAVGHFMLSAKDLDGKTFAEAEKFE